MRQLRQESEVSPVVDTLSTELRASIRRRGGMVSTAWNLSEQLKGLRVWYALETFEAVWLLRETEVELMSTF